MKNGRSRREPERLRIGTTDVNSSDLRGLQQAWRQNRLVLCLGAGLSIPLGVPGWRTLVVELLFDQMENVRALKKMELAERRALAEWVTEQFGADLTSLARAVKTTLKRRSGVEGLSEFVERVRTRLYPASASARSASLEAVAELIEAAAAERRIPAVLTFNFDDFLEAELTRRRVVHHVVADGAKVRGAGVPILHPHGFLPRRGEPRGELVFTEDEYHQVTHSPFHWGMTELAHHLRHHVVLFLGLSMSDSNLRRMLDASRVRGEPPGHWQVQKRHAVGAAELKRIQVELPERVKRCAAVLGTTVKKSSIDDAVLEETLRWADRLDREVFESMGVKTIWIEDFADIPALLAAVRGPPS